MDTVQTDAYCTLHHSQEASSERPNSIEWAEGNHRLGEGKQWGLVK